MISGGTLMMTGGLSGCGGLVVGGFTHLQPETQVLGGKFLSMLLTLALKFASELPAGQYLQTTTLPAIPQPIWLVGRQISCVNGYAASESPGFLKL